MTYTRTIQSREAGNLEVFRWSGLVFSLSSDTRSLFHLVWIWKWTLANYGSARTVSAEMCPSWNGPREWSRILTSICFMSLDEDFTQTFAYCYGVHHNVVRCISYVHHSSPTLQPLVVQTKYIGVSKFVLCTVKKCRGEWRWLCRSQYVFKSAMVLCIWINGRVFLERELTYRGNEDDIREDEEVSGREAQENIQKSVC